MNQSAIAQSGEVAAPQQVEPDPRKIVYTNNISIVVKDPAESAQQIQQMATEAGGYVSQSQLSQYTGDLMRGMVVIRVPVESYAQVLEQIRKLGVRVLSDNSSASDVTSEYTDLEAQLRNLEAAEKELALMLTEVRARPNAKPSDILEVYNALTQKRGEIEQVKGRLQLLQNQVALSTITADLVPDEATKPVVEEGWQPLVTLKDASRGAGQHPTGAGRSADYFVGGGCAGAADRRHPDCALDPAGALADAAQAQAGTSGGVTSYRVTLYKQKGPFFARPGRKVLSSWREIAHKDRAPPLTGGGTPPSVGADWPTA